MKTAITTIIGLCSLMLSAPTLVQAQEAKLFYAQSHNSHAGHRNTVIVVSDDRHNRHRGRGHNQGHSDGHHNDHHYQHYNRGHHGQGYGHVRHHDEHRHHNRHHRRHHYQRPDAHHYEHGGHSTGHNYQSGQEIERVYVNPQLFR